MTADGRYAYTFDAENRLRSVCPLLPEDGALAVENQYDHRHHRVIKMIKRFDGQKWSGVDVYWFDWKGNNTVRAKVVDSSGRSQVEDYVWGMDMSGSEQGAGGVGGLLSVKINDVPYYPYYDNNGNIFGYIAWAGGAKARYDYDPYGKAIVRTGDKADLFAFGFSTKYLDRETGMLAYQRRFYCPDSGRWLARDPIEEAGCANLYAWCGNGGASLDVGGLLAISIDGSYTWKIPTPISGLFVNVTLSLESSLYDCCCNCKQGKRVSVNGSVTVALAAGTQYKGKVRAKNSKGSKCRDSKTGRFVKCPTGGWGAGASVDNEYEAPDYFDECETGFQFYLAIVGTFSWGVPMFGGGELSFEKTLYPKVENSTFEYGETSDLVGLEATIGGKGGLIGQFDAGQGSIEIPDFL